MVVNLIGAVTTKCGLTIRSESDENLYETGRKVPDEEFKSLAMQ